MKRVIKTVALVVGAAVIGAAGYHYWLIREREPGAGQLVLHGNIDIRDAQLAFNGSEHVSEVLVEEGDTVQPGQVLARLVTDRLQAQIAQAQAQIAAQQAVVTKLENGTRPQQIAQARAEVASAQAQVKNAEANLKRLQETVRQGASSEQAVDDARARLAVDRSVLEVKQKALDLALAGPRVEDIDAAKAQLAALRADLLLLQAQLSDATLIAPSAGVIESRLLEPGDMATPATPVFTLALLDPKWVRAYLPEPDLGRIQMGQPAQVLSDSFPGVTFAGWVGFISPVAEFTPKEVQTSQLRTRLVYEVRIYVHDPQNRLRLGQPVTVVLSAVSPPAGQGKQSVPGGPAPSAGQPGTAPAATTGGP